MLRAHASVATRAGAGRSENGDRYLVTDRRIALADGMGGHRAGGTAAQLAIDALERIDPGSTSADVVRGFWIANGALRDDARRHPERSAMGTSLVVLDLVADSGVTSATVASVGDSRLYRWRGGVLWRVTADHTWEGELRAPCAAPQAACRRGHVLTRALGATDLVDVDVWELDAEPGDRFLLCTYGVSGALDDLAIERILNAAGVDAATAADEIVAAAIAAGSSDDATAVVALLTTT